MTGPTPISEPQPIVYLAGGVTGLSWTEAASWRIEAALKLDIANIHSLDPLRGAHPAAGSDEIAASYAEHPLTSPKGIFLKCTLDVKRSSLLLVRITEKISVGTIMELGWATAWGKPVVAFGQERTLHPMEAEAIDIHTASLSNALEVILELLNH